MIEKDKKTADAFANSWNNLPSGSIYTKEQFIDWMQPIEETDVSGKNVLELGCGNASLLFHLLDWNPKYIEGVDLGDSVKSAEFNLKRTGYNNWKIVKGDLTKYDKRDFDVVYSIGVIHHLKEPKDGFDSVIRNTRSGGKFHIWVYAREGNGVVINIVDPIRKIASKLPWWLNKYVIATPLSIPFYIYAKSIKIFQKCKSLKKLPLYEYSLWISNRGFAFFRHVAFDQLVTPQTTYISRDIIEKWMKDDKRIDQNTIYIVMRNGNSWKFGGKKI